MERPAPGACPVVPVISLTQMLLRGPGNQRRDVWLINPSTADLDEHTLEVWLKGIGPVAELFNEKI